MTSNIFGRSFLTIVLSLVISIGVQGQDVTSNDTTIRVEARPSNGFNFPYLVLIPAGLERNVINFLMVEPNNSGEGNDDFSVHEEQARMQLTRGTLGSNFSRNLKIPLLMPVFPRPETDWHLYTQALDRDVMKLSSGKLRRLDLQLVNMIDDARKRLQELGFPVEKQILMTGYSASGVFTNRFTFIHPKLVRAVASGGVNGLPMLPIKELYGESLIYPIGIADFETLFSKPFNLEGYLKVDQFIYMGVDDGNDAILFDDGFSPEERAIIFEVIGKEMMTDRWKKTQEVLKAFDSGITFKTYSGIGHDVDHRILLEILDFYRKAMSR